MNQYSGYCFFKDGSYTHAVLLVGEAEAIAYVQLLMNLQHRVIIVDSEDCIVMEAVDGQIIFPPSNIDHSEKRRVEPCQR